MMVFLALLTLATLTADASTPSTMLFVTTKILALSTLVSSERDAFTPKLTVTMEALAQKMCALMESVFIL
jgi:uncharacterized protein (DUF2141 family)